MIGLGYRVNIYEEDDLDCESDGNRYNTVCKA